jgi:hypothetical protein
MFPRVGRLEGHGIPVLGFLVLGAAAPARAVAHNSCSRLSEYGSAVLLSGLWRPAMEAGSHSRISMFGTEIPSGTRASFLAYVFVDSLARLHRAYVLTPMHERWYLPGVTFLMIAITFVLLVARFWPRMPRPHVLRAS